MLPVVLPAQAVIVAIVIVVDVGGPSAGLDGVPGVAVGPKTLLDGRPSSSGSAPVASMSRGRWVMVVR
jgi:hypothetical protein